MTDLQAPFPYFGGKRRVARVVWDALGPVKSYLEPFFGSGAVLLGRPKELMPDGCYEAVNDADGLLCNVWRAIQHAPDEVARYANWPENENDLHARHAWLVGRREDITRRLEGDPDWYDAKAAGWWVWGAASWLGSGWCSGRGPWTIAGGLLLRTTGGGQGVPRSLIRLFQWRGVQVPTRDVQEWIRKLSERLRRVRVASGDWRRVVTPSVLTLGKKARSEEVGVFLDPPYEHNERYKNTYAIEADIALEVAEWARAHGDKYRIVYAGYSGARVDDVLSGWRTYRWKRSGITFGASGRGANNRHRETLWVSPACENGAQGVRQLELFGKEPT